MCRLLIIFVLIICHTCYSQTINKTLIIDTVTGKIDEFRVSSEKTVDSTSRDKYEVSDSLMWGYYRKITVARTRRDTFPNIVIQLAGADTTLALKLPLDDSGGVAVLKRFFAIRSDTMRISRLHIYHNCLADTIEGGLTWFKRYPKDTGEDNLRTLSSETFPVVTRIKDCIPNYPEEIILVINGFAYRAPMRSFQTPHFDMLIACGGHKKMSKWRERIYERRIEKDKPYKYFSYSRDQRHYGLFAEIILSD